ncbi:ABC transporter permease subunit, partial [Agarivorans sp.]|uniref:ABC transporter permease subunit n=1 Tax=Agarivorans sp. TaxID=1872412 RepID=UPI003D04C075
MSKLNLSGALISTITFMLLAGWLLGIRMEPSNSGLNLALAEPEYIKWLFIGMAAVFVSQLLKPLIFSGKIKTKTQKKAYFKLPSPEQNPKAYRLLVSFALAGAIVWPFVVSRGSVDLATLTLIYVMLGLGLNVVVGLAGLLDLGYVGFYAVGAYTYALLSADGFGFWTCLPIAGGMAALFGFLLGFPVLRLRGDYLAIVTLGFGEIIRLLLNNLTELTGGPNGISGIPKPTLFGLEFNRRVKGEGFETFHDFFG